MSIPAVSPGLCRLVAALVVTLLYLVVPAGLYAKGGDSIAPFPVTDLLALKQEARAVVADSAGNIIAAGYSNNGGMNNDYQITKFKADGSGVAWRATYDKNGGDDQATAVAVDSNNDVIVTGNVWNSSNLDIHTVKYSGSTGAVLWQHTWSGAAGSSDIATSIAVDSVNNIYVAGYSTNSSGNDDFLILKYPSAGSAPEWQELYNSSFNSNDRIIFITAGADGIAVTGASSKGGIDFDILTRKYAFDKTLIWEQRRAGSAGSDDRGVAVKMDVAGNVITTGYLNNGINTDIITLKYSAGGAGSLLWEKIYDGGSSDEPRGLWIDDSGDVFVTGYTITYNGNEDFYTARYDGTSGAKVWQAIYDSGSSFTDIPVAVTVQNGASGGVFVSGYTITNVNSNITTLKYSKNNGALLWQQSYNGAANSDERPVGIALTAAGDVCVGGWSNSAATGYDFAVLKYDFGSVDPPTSLLATAVSNTSVSLQWSDNSVNEDGFKIERKLGETGSYSQIDTVAAGGTSFVDSGLQPNSYYYYRVSATSSASGDSYYSNEAHALTKVISYDPLSWVFTYNGEDNREDQAVGIVAGSDDHPVVTGFSDLTEVGVAGTYSFDYLTMKLDRSDKSVKWKARYDSGDGGTDMAAGVVLDNSGDAIVTGTAYLMGASTNSDDLYTLKYSSAGHTDPNTNPPVVWGSQYGTQAGIDQATAIQAVRDGANNVVVIGHGINTSNDEDIFIIKYRPDGTTPWSPIVYDGSAHGNDYPSAVAFDQSGNIFVTGSTENAAGDFDIYAAKYSGATGGLLWSQIYAGAGNGDDHGVSLAVDNNGDAYISGSSVNASGDEEWLTIKYAGADSAPNREIWKRIHNGTASPVNGNDRAVSVALDPIDGAVVVAGTSFTSLADSDFHLVRYNAADGSLLWERNFDKPGTYDYLTAMTLDASGYIYLTGNSRSGLDTDHAYDSSSDVLSVIYDFEGTFLSASQFDGPLKDEAAAIAVNHQGEAFIAGLTMNASNPDYLLLKQKNSYLLVPAHFTAASDADSAKMNLSWGANTPGAQFMIERTLAPVLTTSNWSPVTSAAAGSTSHQDTGLQSGTGYCYRIYAFSGSLNSRSIISCSLTTLVAPNLTTLSSLSATQMSLAWSQVAGNSGYTVERKTGAAGNWVPLATLAADQNSYIDSSLAAGTQYYFRVVTLSSAGASLPSNELNSFTRSVAPVLGVPADVTNTQMLLSWNSVAGAATYTLQSRLSGGSYADIAACTAVSATSCLAAGLTPGGSYYFKVKATNGGGDSLWSNETVAAAELAVPVINQINSSTSTTMALSWNYPAIPGANVTAFIVEAKIGGAGTYSATACPQNLSTSCSLAGLTPNRNYYFRVKARNISGDSPWSSDQQYWTATPAPELTSLTSSATTEATLSWTAVPETQSYIISRSTCNYSDSDPATCRGNDIYPPSYQEYSTWGYLGFAPDGITSYTDTTVSAGTNYRYRVYSYSAGNPLYTDSNTLNVWTALQSPLLTVTPASSTALNLAWDQHSGETNYTVEVSSTGIAGSYAAIPLATALPKNTVAFDHTGLSLATEYCYRVKAYSTEASLPAPAYSAAVCKTTPPNSPVLSVAASQYESSYTVIQDAAKYWPAVDYWIGRPVVITSGGNTYTRNIAGSTSSAIYTAPPFASETISQGDNYVILQAVSGKATGNDPNGPAYSLFDADKVWGMNEWVGFKIKILNSVNAANIGLERTLAWANGQINVYASENFAAPIVAGDTYQIASFFGKSTGSGSAANQLVDTGSSWTAGAWSGYYLMMTSGRNSGHARRIISNTATSLAVDAFPMAIGTGDTYFIAPAGRVATYFGTAVGAGSTTTQLVDTGNVWQINYTGYYLKMASGSNQDKGRLITGYDNVAKIITVSPPFDSVIQPGDAYMIMPNTQYGAYFGRAAGSPGTSSSNLIDTANTWLNDWTQGYYLMMTSGSNNGQSRLISARSATDITVATPFTNNIGPTDTYLIGQTVAATGAGRVTQTVAPGAAYNGMAKLTLTNDEAEFKSVAPGYGSNFNYELLAIKDLSQFTGNFDAQYDYKIVSGLLADDSSLSYKYLSSSYVSNRFDFQSPTGKTFNTYLQRGRVPLQDVGRSTAHSTGMNTIYDTRTMAGSTVLWKSWAPDQWKDSYLQMTSGPNNQLVRKVTGNTANTVTLNSPFPNDPAARSGAAAASGNSNVRLVDSVVTTWTINQWLNCYLLITSGANAGQVLKVVSSDASSFTVGGAGFSSAISPGDSYRIFNSSGDAYRINIIAGAAAVNGNTQGGKNSTNALLVDSSDTVASTLPPKNWDVNQWQGFYLYMSSGPNIGSFRTISANTANTITVDPPFSYQIASGDSYSIFDPRQAAQAIEAYWVTIYEPVAAVSEQLIIPAADTEGKIKISRSGNSLYFFTAPAGGGWQLRRQLDLAAGDSYTPSLYWVYQLGRLAHTPGATERTSISNFQLATTPPSGANLSFKSFSPEVGHNFRRANEIAAFTTLPVEISWNRIASALFYEIERCPSTDHQDPTIRTVGVCTTFTQSQPQDGTTRIIDSVSSAGLTAGYTYRFRLRAKYNATAYTAWSNEEWITVAPPAPTLYIPAAGEATAGSLALTWADVNGDSGYKLFWKERSGSLCTDDTWNGPISTAMNSTAYTHGGLAAGTYYCYKIAATGPVGPPQTVDSPFSAIVSQATKPIAPVLSPLAGITAAKIDLSWGNVTGNSGYRIERMAEGDALWSTIYNTSADVTGYSDTTVASGTFYTYRLSANSASGYSGLSNEQSTTATPAAAVVTLSVISYSQINVTWPLVRGATNYMLERKSGSDSYSLLENQEIAFTQLYCGYVYPTVGCPSPVPITTSYQNTSLSANTSYCYRVTTWNSAGGYGAASTEKCVSTLNNPAQNLVAVPLNSFKIRLDWTLMSCSPDTCGQPEGYEIERMIRDGIWVNIATVESSVNTFTDRIGIDPLKQYRYRVRSYSSNGKSQYSEAVTYTPAYQSGDNVGP